MAYLEYGLHQSEGFIVITGEMGRQDHHRAQPARAARSAKVVAATIVSTQIDASDMLRMVAGGLRRTQSQPRKAPACFRDRDLLVSLAAADNARC